MTDSASSFPAFFLDSLSAHSTRSTPSRRGLTTPLALAESLALQLDVFERERAREEARQAREMEREMSRMTIERTAGAAGGSGGGQPGSGNLMDELERIRGEARMRSFMSVQLLLASPTSLLSARVV